MSTEMMGGDVARFEPTWQAELIESNQQDGFVIEKIMPAPPDPTNRINSRANEVFGYTSSPLGPDPLQIEYRIAEYERVMQELRREYPGEDRIRIAHPTPEMMRDNPAFEECVHHVLMVRPASPNQ